MSLWDTHVGKKLFSWRGHTGILSALTFSPDGNILASGSWDNTVLLWDVPRARLVGLWSWLSGDEATASYAIKMLAKNPDGAIPYLKDHLRKAAALEKPYVRMIVDLDSDQFATREKATRMLAEAGPSAEFALQLAFRGRPEEEVRKRVHQLLERMANTRDEKIARLVTNLGGDSGQAESAMHKLEAMGEAASPSLLRKSEDSNLAGEVRRNIRQVLSRIKEAKTLPSALSPQAVLHAVLVLERIANPEAYQILHELTKGEPESLITREAKTALARRPKVP